MKKYLKTRFTSSRDMHSLHLHSRIRKRISEKNKDEYFFVCEKTDGISIKKIKISPLKKSFLKFCVRNFFKRIFLLLKRKEMKHLKRQNIHSKLTILRFKFHQLV